jgi:hypothetical protein
LCERALILAHLPTRAAPRIGSNLKPWIGSNLKVRPEPPITYGISPKRVHARDPMQWLQAISGTIYLVVATILGIRLLVQARRERQMPELLLGITFLAAPVLGAPLEVAGEALGTEQPGEMAASVFAVGKILTIIGLNAVNLFTWLVFRPGRVWAGALFFTILAGQLVAFGGFAASGTFLSGGVSMSWFWFELAFRAAGSIWMLSECIHYAGKMRRRVEIGLADPIVAHRFVLWAGGNLGGLCMLATSVSPKIFGVEGAVPQLTIVLFATAGLVAAGSYWLAFFPTAGYRRWIGAHSAA